MKEKEEMRFYPPYPLKILDHERSLTKSAVTESLKQRLKGQLSGRHNQQIIIQKNRSKLPSEKVSLFKVSIYCNLIS